MWGRASPSWEASLGVELDKIVMLKRLAAVHDDTGMSGRISWDPKQSLALSSAPDL